MGESGNHHYQGYLQCSKQRRLTALAAWFSDKGTKATTWGFHWEKQSSRSSNKQCRDYCFKECGEEALYEWGTFKEKGQGTRTDIHTMTEAIKKGATRDEVIDKFAVQLVKYRGGVLGLMADVKGRLMPKRRDVRVVVYHGITDSGKSWAATDGHAHPSFYCTGVTTKWWCDYRGEKRLVVDEFANNSMDIRELIKICDEAKMKLAVKNAHTFAEWNEVFITTNLTYPDDFYPHALPKHRNALFRRVNFAYEFTKPWGEQTPPPDWEDWSQQDGRVVEEQTDNMAEQQGGLQQLHGFIFDD